MPIPAQPPGANQRLTFAVIALGALSYSLLQSLVLPALPEIQRAVHTSTTNVTWLLTAFLLSARWSRRSPDAWATCSENTGCWSSC